MSALTWFYGRRFAVVTASVVTASVLTGGGAAGEQRLVDPPGRTPPVSPIEVQLVNESLDTSTDATPAPLLHAAEATHAQAAA